MLKSSIGFHTLRFSIPLSGMEIRGIKDVFKFYSETFGKMKIYPVDKDKLYYKVEFTGEYKGVFWVLKFCELPSGYKCYFLDIIINPKILTGENDYITAANETYVDKMKYAYNALVNQISNEIPTLSRCHLAEVHHCINFMLSELHYHEIGCTTEQMIKILKRANIPDGFTEKLDYNSISHRKKSYETSLYLISKPVTINCYEKEQEMKERLEKHPERENDIESATNVIRFEVQCKIRKIQAMRREIIGNSNNEYLLNEMDITKKLLSETVSKWIIHYYFNNIILGGNYYERQRAIDTIKLCCRFPKRERLITALELIGNKRGIYKAREFLKEKINKNEVTEITLEDFDTALHELPELGINPVTLPRPWGIPCMPGLLNAFEISTGIHLGSV